jgi:hypothetical protein
MASAASSIDAEYTIADDNLQTPNGKEETENASIYRARATWHMAPELRQIQERDEAGGEKPKMLGVAWQNLTVTGVGCDATFNENVVSSFFPSIAVTKAARLRPSLTIHSDASSLGRCC